MSDFLKKTKNRAFILWPPTFLCITALGFLYAHIISNFSFVIPDYIRIVYVVSATWLIIGGLIITINDCKTTK